MVRERAGRRVTLLRAFIKAESRERTIRGNLSWRGSSTRGAYNRGKQYCLLGNNYSREEGKMQEVSNNTTYCRNRPGKRKALRLPPPNDKEVSSRIGRRENSI